MGVDDPVRVFDVHRPTADIRGTLLGDEAYFSCPKFISTLLGLWCKKRLADLGFEELLEPVVNSTAEHGSITDDQRNQDQRCWIDSSVKTSTLAGGGRGEIRRSQAASR